MGGGEAEGLREARCWGSGDELGDLFFLFGGDLLTLCGRLVCGGGDTLSSLTRLTLRSGSGDRLGEWCLRWGGGDRLTERSWRRTCFCCRGGETDADRCVRRPRGGDGDPLSDFRTLLTCRGGGEGERLSERELACRRCCGGGGEALADLGLRWTLCGEGELLLG